MAGRVEHTAGDASVVVVIQDDHPVMNRTDWIRILEADGPTDVDAQAAEILLELRERCEGADADRS